MLKLWTIIFCLSGSWVAKAKADELAVPGLLESTKRLVEKDQSLQKQWDQLPTLPSQAKNLNTGALQLNALFLNSLLLNSSLPYLSFTWNNSCALVDLLWLNMLKDARSQDITYLVVDVLQNDRTYKSYKISRQDYIQEAYRTSCPDSSRLAFQYGQKDLGKVLRKVDLKLPKDRLDCENVLKNLVSSSHAPYYCYFHQLYRQGREAENYYKVHKKVSAENKKKILQGRSLIEWLGQERLNYLDNFCTNAHRPDMFCQTFFTQNYFQSLAIKDNLRFLLEPECGKKNLNLNESQRCASELMQRPNFCYQGQPELGTITPRASCPELSDLMNLSRLAPNYRDCPEEVWEDHWITYSRLALYFQRVTNGKNDFKISKELVQPWSEGSPYCSTNHYQLFYEFAKQEKMLDHWKFQICLEEKTKTNPIKNCSPVFWKSPQDQFLPLKKAVEQLLSKKTGVFFKGSCTYLSQKDYNPDLLKFRNGCYIITNPQTCHLYSCPLTVILDDRDQRAFLNFSSGIDFSSLPPPDLKGKTDTQVLLERLGVQEKKLRTYSELMKFLKKYPAGIILGNGCLEDLRPNQFVRHALGQCTYTPFLIDGYQEGEGQVATTAQFVTRTSLDEVFSPFFLEWKDLLSSLKNFQNAFDRNQFELRGLYHE